MDWWQILLIVMAVVSTILGGRAVWKKKVKSILLKTANTTREISEAFYGSSLIGLRASEVLEKLANDPSSLTKEEITAVWKSCQAAGVEWSEAFQSVKEIFYALH